jgi:hypothetical protein
LRFKANLDKKFMRLHLNQWLRKVVHACQPQLLGEAQIRDHCPGHLGIKKDSISKITNAKKAQLSGSSGGLPA